MEQFGSTQEQVMQTCSWKQALLWKTLFPEKNILCKIHNDPFKLYANATLILNSPSPLQIEINHFKSLFLELINYNTLYLHILYYNYPNVCSSLDMHTAPLLIQCFRKKTKQKTPSLKLPEGTDNIILLCTSHNA